MGGTQERVCDSTRAWHKSCFARITLNSGTSATFRYSQLAWPAATAQLYHEFKVRCPTYSNSTDCVITAEVKALDPNGNTIQTYTNANVTIPNDGIWREVRVATGAFSSATETRRFIIRGGTNDTFHVDYNQQWFLNPA